MIGLALAALAAMSLMQDRPVPEVEAADVRIGANYRPAARLDKAAWERRPITGGYQPAPGRLTFAKYPTNDEIPRTVALSSFPREGSLIRFHPEVRLYEGKGAKGVAVSKGPAAVLEGVGNAAGDIACRLVDGPDRCQGVTARRDEQYAGVGVDGDTHGQIPAGGSLQRVSDENPSGLGRLTLGAKTEGLSEESQSELATINGAMISDSRNQQPGQNRHASIMYRWSVAALIAGAALDTASSWGRYELNPVLGRGEFGRRQVGIKVGLTAGALGAQRLLLRRWNGPKSRRALAVLNLLQAGALGVVAGRNWT